MAEATNSHRMLSGNLYSKLKLRNDFKCRWNVRETGLSFLELFMKWNMSEGAAAKFRKDDWKSAVIWIMENKV